MPVLRISPLMFKKHRSLPDAVSLTWTKRAPSGRNFCNSERLAVEGMYFLAPSGFAEPDDEGPPDEPPPPDDAAPDGRADVPEVDDMQEDTDAALALIVLS